MKSLAIIGTGIAGMACAQALYREYDLSVYERNNYAGGHTNTVMIPEGDRQIPIDTGFMVYNEVTYPELTKLFAALQVPTKATAMSFSVQHIPTGLEFCGSGLNGLFAQRRNLFNPSFWLLLKEIARFNAEAPAILDDGRYQSMTLADYARAKKHSAEFLDRYLIPMSSAVWSTPSNAMLEFPAATLVRFFKNHGFLGLNTQHSWRTVDGGSRLYRDKIVSLWKDKLALGRSAVSVTRQEGRAVVRDSLGRETNFDAVVLATHADEALSLLSGPTALESELLSLFHYQKNTAILHTDDSVMPQTRSAWSSWNYRAEKDRGGHTTASTIYWMNSLQQVSDRQNYFVSINDSGRIQRAKILRTIIYDHPIFTTQTTAAQARLPQLNDNGPVYFCGSYFRYGFHEDALLSGLQVVKRLAGGGA